MVTPPRETGQPSTQPPAPRGGVVLRLILSLARTRALTKAGRRPALPPAGSRSGSGSESLGPYLEEGRSTRPTPLE